MTATTTIDPPQVLVVGAGPAGLVTGIELARHGARPLVVERHPSTSIFPRATGVSTRSMEIFRSYGLEDAVRRGGWRVIPMQATVRRLDDRAPVESPLGFPDEAASRAVSPTWAAVSPQDHLEPLLVEHLRSLGGEIRFSTELVSLIQDADGMTVELAERGSGVRTTLRVASVVGADGHRSTVRDLVGIPMVGPDDLGRFHSVLFRADLDEVLGDRRYGLYQVGEPTPDRPPTIVVPSGADDRFVLAIPLPPGMDDAAVAATFPLDRCIALIREAAGRPDLEVDILATSTFAFSAQIAARWRADRVFLVGDAAHRMTPRGGRGMNTAIADGHALGWRLAWVLTGRADPSLLDTYETERGPIGRRNVEMSMVPGGGGTDDGLLEDLGPLDGRPGQRVPHAWLDAGAAISTLDVGGTGFALLVADELDAWRAAAAAIDAPRRPTLARTSSIGLGQGGTLLVRPDGVIVARTDALPADPAAWLAAALADVLGAGPSSPGDRTPVAPRRPSRVAAVARMAVSAMGRGFVLLAAGWGPFPPVVLPTGQPIPRAPRTSGTMAMSDPTVATTMAPRATQGSHGGTTAPSIVRNQRTSEAIPTTATAQPPIPSGPPSTAGATMKRVSSTPSAAMIP